MDNTDPTIESTWTDLAKEYGRTLRESYPTAGWLEILDIMIDAGHRPHVAMSACGALMREGV